MPEQNENTEITEPEQPLTVVPPPTLPGRIRRLKIQVKAASGLGAYAEACGVRKVGHGWIAEGGASASEVIKKCDAYVNMLMSKVPPADPSEIISVLAIQRDFTQLLIKAGQEHIEADKLAVPITSDKANTVSFPANTPIAVVVGARSQAAQPAKE